MYTNELCESFIDALRVEIRSYVDLLGYERTKEGLKGANFLLTSLLSDQTLNDSVILTALNTSLEMSQYCIRNTCEELGLSFIP